MNPLKFKTRVIAIFIAGSILFGNVLPVLALERNSKQEITFQKSDSTKIKSANTQSITSTTQKKEVDKAKSTANFSYNFIYYLILQFLKINPFSRP